MNIMSACFPDLSDPTFLSNLSALAESMVAHANASFGFIDYP